MGCKLFLASGWSRIIARSGGLEAFFTQFGDGPRFARDGE